MPSSPLLDFHAKIAQPLGHGGDAVGLFERNSLTSAKRVTPWATAPAIARIGYSSMVRATSSGPTSTPRSCPPVTRISATRSPASVRSLSNSMRRAHGAENLDDAIAGRIAADIADRHIRAGNHRRRDEKKRRRRNIPRNAHILAAQRLPALNADMNAVDVNLAAETANHHFGVIARTLRLFDPSLALRPATPPAGSPISPGRWRWACGNDMPCRPPPSNFQRRQAVAGFAANLRAHLRQADRSPAASAAGGSKHRHRVRCETADRQAARTSAASSCRSCRNRSLRLAGAARRTPCLRCTAHRHRRPISTPNWRNARTVRELSSPPES